MEIILKASACALISVVLSMVIAVQNKEISLLLTTAVCCMIASLILTYFRPSVDFLQELSVIGNIGQDTLRILIKSVGIAILSEITGLICADAGNSSLGKILQLLGAVIILQISLPILNRMMDLIEKIIGAL